MRFMAAKMIVKKRAMPGCWAAQGPLPWSMNTIRDNLQKIIMHSNLCVMSHTMSATEDRIVRKELPEECKHNVRTAVHLALGVCR